MNKKLVAIIVGTLAVLAIVLISIFGSQMESGDNHRNVLGIEVITEGVEPTTYFDEDGTTKIVTLIMEEGTTEYSIVWNVLPENATDKSVTFTSNNSAYATVTNLGVVTFLQEESIQITITSVDDSSIKIIVNFVFPSPTESFLNVEIENDNVNFTLQTDAHLLHSYESSQLVLLEVSTFTFGVGENITLQIEEGTSATLDGNILTTGQSEEFVMTLTQTSEEQEDIIKTVSVKVIPYVSVFNIGSQYSSYLNTIIDFEKPAEEQTTEFLNKMVTTYLVGSGNEYYFNISLRRPNDQALTQSEIELNYVVKDINDDDVELSDIASLNGNNILFNSNAVGNVYTFLVTPKYNEIFNRSTLVYWIEVNEGVNIWTSDQLYNTFKDLAVSEINIHSAILVTPRANQLVTVIRDEVEETRLNNYNGISASNALRENCGTLYPRYIPSNYTGKNEVTLNGNYFTLNANSVPYFNYDGRDGQSGALPWATEIASVQEGLFQVQDDRAVASKDENNYASATYNNLKIKGNSAKGPIYTLNDQYELTDEEEVKRLTEQGSGLPIIMTRGGIINVNNVVASNSIFTFWSSGTKARVELNDAKTYDIWGGAIYGFCTSEIELTNVNFSRLGGAAISYEDSTYSDWMNPEYTQDYLNVIEPYTAAYLDLILTFNENVVIDNFLSGLEGWFVVNGFTGIVPTLKTSVNGQLNLASKAMVKGNTETNSDDFNYILQIVSTSSINSKPNKANSTDPDFKDVDLQYTIKQIIGYDEVTGERIYRTTERKTGFQTSHPFTSLSATGGAYIGSLGTYSSIGKFKEMQHTIYMVGGYLTQDANAVGIFSNFAPGLAETLNAGYSALTGGAPLAAFTSMPAGTQQSIILALSGFENEDNSLNINNMVNTMLSNFALYDATTAGSIKGAAESSDSTKMGAFAVALNFDDHKVTDDILEIMPGFKLDGRQLALFVEYFDYVAA